MISKKTLLILFSLLQFFQFFAQEQEIIKAYNYRYIDSSASVFLQKKIYQQAFVKKNKQTECISNSFLSLTYLRLKKLQSAKEAIEKAAALIPEIKDANTLGYYYYALYRYKYYIDEINFGEDLLKSLTYFEQNKNYTFAALSAIGIANSGEFINKKFLDKGVFYALKSNNSDVILEAQICSSTFLKQQFEINSKLMPIEKVIDSFEKTIQLANKNTFNKMNVAIAYLNYANFLVSINHSETKILYLINEALTYAEKYGIVSVVRNCYGIKGLLYKNDFKLNDAENSFLKGISYLKTLPFKEYETETKFYTNLKEIAALKKDFIAYHKYDLFFQEATNFSNKSERENAIQNAMAKYDLKNKEEKIALLSRKNQLKDGLILLSLITILLGIGFFIYYKKSTSIKQIYLEQKKNKLQLEKEQTQKELINSVLHLEKKNEILNELKDKLLVQNKDQHVAINNTIFKTIDAGLAVDDDFEKFKNNFNTIYPDFFNRLQEKANHSLTQLDLKYCGFILMKVTNKEIASQMNVEPKSIRMARYRIKQKLELSKDEDLDTFIQSAN
jgi:DNA-binding CsgD family transcriptional regulator